MRRFPILRYQKIIVEDGKEKRNGKGGRLVIKFQCIYYVTRTFSSVDLSSYRVKGREIKITKFNLFYSDYLVYDKISIAFQEKNPRNVLSLIVVVIF